MAQIISNKDTDVIVVGAGICGLLAAKTLTASGYRVLVLDKSRGVGGRLATRRWEGAVFDHGAQYFTAQDPVFCDLVKDWLEEKIVRLWATGFSLEDGRLKQDGQQRFCGISGMATIAKHLAHGLEVRVANRIIQVASHDDGWSLTTELGEIMTGRALLLTPPVPQSLALLAEGGVTLPEQTKMELEEIEYAPCLALLVLLSEASLIPEPGGLWLSGEPISWIADNQRKGISPDSPAALTIHAGPTYSRRHWETLEQEVTEDLLASAKPWLGSAPVRTQLHRWRYSLPIRTHREPCVSLIHPAPIVFAGDAFGGPKIEGAALSGLAAGASLVRLLGLGTHHG